MGIEVQIYDGRARPIEPEDDESLMDWLYGFQKAAVWSVIKGGGRGLLKLPTASGKSEIFIALTRMIPCEWLYLVHRRSLVKQMADRYLERTGEQAGTFSQSRWARGSCNVTVSTFQSLMAAGRRNPGALQTFLGAEEALCVDEVQSQSASRLYATTLSLEKAYYRVGMSGTPLDRSDADNLRTIGALGPLLFDLPYGVLVAADPGTICSVSWLRGRRNPASSSWRSASMAGV
jgi:superfamily II DNA or RNA helicase